MSYQAPELARRRGGTGAEIAPHEGWSGVAIGDLPDAPSEGGNGGSAAGQGDDSNTGDEHGLASMPSLAVHAVEAGDEGGNEEENEALQTVRRATISAQVCEHDTHSPHASLSLAEPCVCSV